MKIIIIGSAYPFRAGGITTYNERLARAFQERGDSVSIYTFSLQYPGFLFPGTTQYSTEPAPTDLNIKVRINSINPFNWFIVGKELKKINPDIIIVRYWLPFMGPCLGTILRIIKRNKHTKIVCIADNIIPHEKRLGDKTFTKYFLKPVDSFITMSEKVLGDLVKIAPTKPVIFVPHPLYDNFGEKISKQDARKKISINTDQVTLLFFGFIRKYKGLDILLDAMKILKEKNINFNYQHTIVNSKNIKLLIAGEFYEDQKIYEDQIKNLAIKDSLFLHTEFIPDSEVKYYFCAADVVIQPYRNATQSGVTPLAYHFEIPMIVTNVGGLPSLVPDNIVGLIAEPNATSIAEKIILFFEKGEQYFIPNIIEEKKKYSWDNMTTAIINLAK